MESNLVYIASRIKAVRLSRGLKQSELDERANLSKAATTKIERGLREATASELVRIAKALGVTLDTLATGKTDFVYQEELKVVEALRAIPFEDYKRILGMVEAQVYFSAKDTDEQTKEYLLSLVTELAHLSQVDRRPRSDFAERKRIKDRKIVL